jgi:hypothetical protein
MSAYGSDALLMAPALLQALPPAAQGLYLRLVLRRGPWFALQALQYPELPDPLPAAQELIMAGVECRGAAASGHAWCTDYTDCSLARMPCLQQDWSRPGHICCVLLTGLTVVPCCDFGCLLMRLPVPCHAGFAGHCQGAAAAELAALVPAWELKALLGAASPSLGSLAGHSKAQLLQLLEGSAALQEAAVPAIRQQVSTAGGLVLAWQAARCMPACQQALPTSHAGWHALQASVMQGRRLVPRQALRSTPCLCGC